MKITKTWARKALRAVNILIERYKAGEKSTNTDCPFCEIFLCEECPWVIFKGYTCEGYSYKDEKDILDEYYSETPIPQRLPRLYGWRKRLTNIIERGK